MSADVPCRDNGGQLIGAGTSFPVGLAAGFHKDRSISRPGGGILGR
jgi:hypothetical protein